MESGHTFNVFFGPFPQPEYAKKSLYCSVLQGEAPYHYVSNEFIDPPSYKEITKCPKKEGETNHQPTTQTPTNNPAPLVPARIIMVVQTPITMMFMVGFVYILIGVGMVQATNTAKTELGVFMLNQPMKI